MDSNQNMGRMRRVEMVGNYGGHAGATRSSGGGFVDPVEVLIEQLRREARAADLARAESRQKRMEAMYQAILKSLREDDERRRNSWLAKAMRRFAALGAMASAVWNSRAVRTLVP